MANDSKTPASTTPDDAASDAASDAAPAPGAPDPLVPDASIEPAAQAAAATASTVPPPLPADYEMPDDYTSDDPLATVKAWVEGHPGLSILAAAGIGLVVGRVVTGLFPDPEPPSLADRVEKRAHQLKKEAEKRGKQARKRGKVYKKEVAALASSTEDSLQDSLHRASEALREAASATGHAAEEGYEKTKDLAETIADAAKVAVTGVVAAKLDDWIGKVKS